MVYAFFDLKLVGVLRYPAEVAFEIKKLKPDASFVFFFDDFDGFSISDVQNKLPEDSELIQINDVSYSSISNLLKGRDVGHLTVMAQRIPDSAFVSIANRLGITTTMMQHGLYIPFIKREKTVFIKKLAKVARFIKYLHVISKAIDIGFLKALKSYYNVFVKGLNLTDSGLPLSKINTNSVLVYGDYWKEYHRDNFGYDTSDCSVIGYPDLEELKGGVKTSCQDGVCYIAQTLVEDGRLDKSILLEFLNNLLEACKSNNEKLTIKLHPRSNLELYSCLEGYADFELKEFPLMNKYIGHYSSLIGKAAFVSNTIAIIDFPGHEIPKYLSEVCEYRYSYDDLGSLKSFSSITSKGSKDSIAKNIQKLERVFGTLEMRPITNAAIKITGK